MVLYNSIILLNEAVRANWEIENARHKKKYGQQAVTNLSTNILKLAD